MKTKYTLALAVTLAAMLTHDPLRAADEDARIVTAAKQSYVYRTYLKHDDIQIQARDGAVTLTGEVVSSSHKRMAEDTVENLPGVKTVKNQLVVKPASEKPDGQIEFNIKATLLFHPSVSTTKTTVSVKDGTVTLGGTATSEAQKELTEEYTRDVEGVKDVKNDIKVVSTAPARTFSEVVDDASITAQIKSALLTHRSTGALKTKVATRDGVVTLSGEAKNKAEKALVTKLAGDIHGVKTVINNMEVKE